MSLPWFPFKIGDYVRDTMRLSTEGHGAYLLLILDYYATEQAPPDDDEVLAAITKLPVDVWKAKHRRTIEVFFEVRDGRWHHDRIETEIAERTEKHTKAVEKATKASAARHSKATSETPPRKPRAAPKPAAAPAQASLQDDTSTSTSTSPLRGEEAPPARFASQGLGTPIPKDWMPTMEARTTALAAAITDEEFGAEVRKFVATKTADGAFSNDWDASFAVWIEREIQFREKRAQATKAKAPPRIEVNVSENWDAACDQWVKLGRWPRNHGPDPSSPACRAPPDVRAAHGIDGRGDIVKVKA